MSNAVKEAVSTWMDDAACRRIPCFTELPIAQQLSVCPDCPVQLECLQYGLDITVDVRPACVYGGQLPATILTLAKATHVKAAQR